MNEEYDYICIFCGTETNEQYCNICNDVDGIVDNKEES